MHCLRTDLATGIVEVDIVGFWTLTDVAALASDLREAREAVAATGRRHRVFYDYSQSRIQPQEVIAALQELVRTVDPPALRTALFTGGHLARMQAGRIASVRESIRLFDDRACAMDWLRDAPAPSVATAPVARPAAH